MKQSKKKIYYYYFWFYLVYKFVKVSSSKKDQHKVLDASYRMLNISQIVLWTNILLFLDPFKHIEYNLYCLIVIFCAPLLFLYFLNHRAKNNYVSIVSYFDSKNKLSKTEFIVIGTLLTFGTIPIWLLSGYYYFSIN
jgi:Na+/H+ antiporter NhaC